MTDPAEIRAEGRRLLERYETSDPVTNRPTPQAVERWFWTHADVLLADPAPTEMEVGEGNTADNGTTARIVSCEGIEP